MEKTITEILNILGASPADYLIFTMGMMVVFVLIWAIRRISMMERKYHIIDKNHLVLWDRVDPKRVKWHHSGDYHIDHKADE